MESAALDAREGLRERTEEGHWLLHVQPPGGEWEILYPGADDVMLEIRQRRHDKLTPTSINRLLGTLKAALRFAQSESLITAVPAIPGMSERERGWLELPGIVAGRFSGEQIVTSCFTTVWPGSVSSQLPPVSPARSTMTLPGFIPATAPAVTATMAATPTMETPDASSVGMTMTAP